MVRKKFTDNPFHGLTKFKDILEELFFLVPVDHDSDGDMDLYVFTWNGKSFYFKNTGNATKPVYMQQMYGLFADEMDAVRRDTIFAGAVQSYGYYPSPTWWMLTEMAT